MSPPAVRRRGRPPSPPSLSAEQRQALVRLRDTGPKPYLRERAAAVLKVADGEPVAQVAQSGRLRRRRVATVYGWLQRYPPAGGAGLTLRPGRGRRPAFSPSPPASRSC